MELCKKLSQKFTAETRSLEETFLQACLEGDLITLEECHQQGVNPNCTLSNYTPGLLTAVLSANVRLGKKLLTFKDVDVDLLTVQQRTPLHCACIRGLERMCRLLLKNGANPNVRDVFGKTPLHYACANRNFQIVRYLCGAGANPNDRDIYKDTPLSWTVIHAPNYEFAQLLMRYGAEINLTVDMSLPLLLHCALGCKTAEDISFIIFLINSGADINIRDPITRKNVLHVVAATGYAPLARQLLHMGANANKLDYVKRSPLDVAVQHEQLIYVSELGDLERVEFLIKEGADPCFQTNDFRNVLHYAVESDCLPLWNKLMSSKVKINFDLVSNHVWTPLHVAARNGTLRMVNLLISRKANVNKVDVFGKTPLHYACIVQNRKIVEVLCLNGGDVNALDTLQRTPLNYVLTNKPNFPIAEILIKHHADIDFNFGTSLPIFLECALNCHAEDDLNVFYFLAEQGADVNIRATATKRNALHIAAISGYVPLILVLLDLGVNKNCMDVARQKPTDVAMMHGNLDAVMTFHNTIYNIEANTVRLSNVQINMEDFHVHLNNDQKLVEKVNTKERINYVIADKKKVDIESNNI